MNIDDYLDMILVKHIDKQHININDIFNPIIYNKILDAVSCNKIQQIKFEGEYYVLNTYFDIIKDITSDTDISIIIDNKEINDIETITLPIISLKSKIFIKKNY